MTTAGGSSALRRQARHQARVLALQALYETDVARHAVDAVLERLLGGAQDPSLVDEAGDADQALERLVGQHAYAPATVAFARRLVRGVVAHLDQIDTEITGVAPTWPLEQMAKVDKNVLRIAIYELLHEPNVPLRAVINEAVEIAKDFGSGSSGRFVNGVLGTVAERHDRGVIARPSRARPVDSSPG